MKVVINMATTPTQIRIDSDRNNWMSAEEALNYGLIDKTIISR